MVAVAVAGGVGNGVGGVGPLWWIVVRSPASAITRSDVGGVKEGHRGTQLVSHRGTQGTAAVDSGNSTRAPRVSSHHLQIF